MFGAGIGVIIKEEAHAAISSVDIQTAPILLLVAGSLSLLVALIGIYFMKRCPTLNDIRTALIVLVSSIVLNNSYPASPAFFRFPNSNCLYIIHFSCL